MAVGRKYLAVPLNEFKHIRGDTEAERRCTADGTSGDVALGNRSDDEPIDVTSIPVNEKSPLSVADNGPFSRVSNGIRTRDLRNHNPAL